MAGRPGFERADGYMPIAGYGVIGNLYTVALVAADGSIDWCCLPALDHPSVFGALLDSRRGGRFRVAPRRGHTAQQRYVERTNVLETTFDADGGRLVVTDFMPLRGSIIGCDDPDTRSEIHRILRAESGAVDVEVEWSPRPDYARRAVRLAVVGGVGVAESGAEWMTITGLPQEATTEIAEEGSGAALRARFRLAAGEEVVLVTRYGSGEPRPALAATPAALTETIGSWRDWVNAGLHLKDWTGEWRDAVIRSELALKLLSFPHTGAIAAAATTSLPEEIGGSRNWDYRFTWIRDAAFTVQALLAAGHHAEAVDFFTWLEHAAMAGERMRGLRIMYGLRGETELTEIELEHLEGYRCSRPVRVGNAAALQRQHDIYGELLAAAYEFVRRGYRLEPEILSFLSRVADEACVMWREPDYGIWEVRGGPRHFVHSKVMVWVALDRALRMTRHGLRGNVARWRHERRAVREAVLAHGYDASVGAFVQSFGSRELDASSLHIPLMEFLPFDDPRVQGTIDRTREHLMQDGLVYRYLGDDGLPGGEGAFGLCTFWMVDALALSGRVAEARELFAGLAGRANHLGLYSEEFDPHTGALLGNFPQAFSHIGLINSVLYLSRAEGQRAEGQPVPVGAVASPAESDGDGPLPPTEPR